MSLGILGVCDICLNSIYFIPDYFFCSFIWVQISGHDQSCFVLLKFFLFEENCNVTKIWKIHHCAALFWGSLLNIVSLYVSMMREISSMTKIKYRLENYFNLSEQHNDKKHQWHRQQLCVSVRQWCALGEGVINLCIYIICNQFEIIK